MLDTVGATHEDAVIHLIDKTPAGFGSVFSQLRDRAASFGIGFWHLAVYLAHNQAALVKLLADSATDVGKAIDDLIADYRAANP